MQRERRAALFALGQIVATPAFLEAVPRSAMIEALSRHAVGDFGLCEPEDMEANRQAIRDGERILSVYEHAGERFWLLTEADRSVTTFLLPSDY